MKVEALRDWLALSLWDELGPSNLSRIRLSIPEPWRILDDTALMDVIFNGRTRPIDPPRDDLRRKADWLISLSDKGLFRILTIFDPVFPRLLKEISVPPAVLYTIGNQDLMKQHCLAVVGTRHPTPYGRKVTRYFSENLAANGMVIVSGMAIGIDAIAHTSALDGNGKTIAVLGCGVDNPYPKSNAALRKRIEQSGCIVSEFPWGTPPNPGQFPRRNRIIAGLSRGVLIVESSEKSGALITVRYAIEENRDVFAVPGPIDSPGTRGPVRVLQRSGYPVLEPDDILAHYSGQVKIPFPQPVFSEDDFDIEPEMRPIWDLLDATPVSIDDLIGALRWEAADIQTALLKMELLGLIHQLPGQRFVRATAPSNQSE
ncbi:DNA-processing protein DprA [bacterium]|nr:DNA-processing protein DprA [candidate division CSSED10-310 bacterium]